jgi:hypothetical protein
MNNVNLNSTTVWCSGCQQSWVQPRYGTGLCGYCIGLNTSSPPRRARHVAPTADPRPGWYRQLSALDVSDLDGAVALIEQHTGQAVPADKLALIRAYLDGADPVPAHRCPRMCLVCRADLDGTNSNARTCGPACRKAWSRWSQVAEQALDLAVSHLLAACVIR